MQTLLIPDEVLKRAGLSDREALIELACRLFDTGKLTLFFAAKLADVPPPEFEAILFERNIPIYRFNEEDLANDLRALREDD